MEAALQQAGASIPSREAGAAFFKLLFTILKNIAEKPSEPKFRTVKLANKGFHSKVGQFAGGVECMKALGFAESDGRLELQLVWGLPDVGKLRSGYDAMCRTAQMLGVETPAISFAACEGGGDGAAPSAPAPDPATAAESTAASAPVDDATVGVPPRALPAGGAVRTFNVRDSRKYQVGAESTFRSRDGVEVSGVVLTLAPLVPSNPSAPHAAKATVLVSDDPSSAPPTGPPPLLNLNAETRLAPSGWAAQKQARLEALRTEVLGVTPRPDGSPPRELRFGTGTEERLMYKSDSELLGSVAAAQQAKAGGSAVGWVQAGQETRQQEEERKLKALTDSKTTSVRFRLPGSVENLAVSAEFSSNEPVSALEAFLRSDVLKPVSQNGQALCCAIVESPLLSAEQCCSKCKCNATQEYTGEVALLMRPPIPPVRLEAGDESNPLSAGASRYASRIRSKQSVRALTWCAVPCCVLCGSSLMAYGREWTGRIEYKEGGEKRMAWSYQGTPAAAQQKFRQTLAPRAQLILSVEPSAIREDVLAAAKAAAEEVRWSVE